MTSWIESKSNLVVISIRLIVNIFAVDSLFVNVNSSRYGMLFKVSFFCWENLKIVFVEILLVSGFGTKNWEKQSKQEWIALSSFGLEIEGLTPKNYLYSGTFSQNFILNIFCMKNNQDLLLLNPFSKCYQVISKTIDSFKIKNMFRFWRSIQI